MRFIPLQVSIPEPCHEKWEEMTPLADGRRHCHSCTRNLIDFTYLTDREIHQFLRDNNGKICGRWRKSQLGRPIHATPPQTKGFRAAAMIGGLLAATSLQAQNAPLPAPGYIVVEEVIEPVKAEQKMPSSLVNGQVTDDSGEPLIGATIMIKDTKLGTIADQDGHFSLEVEPGQIIQVSYIGFATSEMLMTEAKLGQEAQKMRIVLSTGIDLPEVVITAAVPITREIYMGAMEVATHQCFSNQEEQDEEQEPKEKETVPSPTDNYFSSASVFPNPISDYIGLELAPDQSTKMVASLFTLQGQPLRTWAPRELEAGRQEQRFSVSRLHLLPGHYYFVMEDQSGIMETRVVIKGR